MVQLTLGQVNKLGLEIVNILAKSNIKIIHAFYKRKKLARKKKLSFFQGDARVKATTIHSFKGWEANNIVMLISLAGGGHNLASIYTGLTRLKHSDQGSNLIVICSCSKLESYGQTWPNFERI